MVTSEKYKQVLHREVIRFLTGSEKTIGNNWKDGNKTKQKRIIEREGSRSQVLRKLHGGERTELNGGGEKETDRARKNNGPHHWLGIREYSLAFNLHNNSLRYQRQELISFLYR